MLELFSYLKNLSHKAKNQHLLIQETDYKIYVNSKKFCIHPPMSDPQNPPLKANHHRCACCTKAKFEIPEEMMTEEMKLLKEKMSDEEFEKLMMGLM